MAKILVVEDEDSTRATVKGMLQDHEVAEAADVESAKTTLDTNSFDIVLVDMRMPFSNRSKTVDEQAGLGVIDYAMQQEPSQICIVMTAYGSVENMFEAIQKGAWDYIGKPFSENRLLSRIDSALELRKVGWLSPSVKYRPLIGGSQAMRALHKLISRIAQSDAIVLITGETGTGKELVARAIHYESFRRHGPFIPVTCSAIPSELMECELFGHKKGAFTEASYDRPGVFAAAEGGTIFLDEIGEMPVEMQTKLLRVLQEKMIKRVGEDHERPVDVRVIAATNKDIEQAVEDGKLREDLYHRLKVLTITVPPLRERKEDIPLLVEHFLKKHSGSYCLKRISDEAMNPLCEHDWPGNVRELENTIQRAIALAVGTVIQPSDFSLVVTQVTECEPPRWPNEPEKAQFESFKRLVELDNNWNMIENYLVAAAMSERDQDAEAAKLIGMPSSTLQSKKKSIKRALKKNLPEFLKKQGKSETEISDEIEELDKQLGDLKTREEREKLVEKIPLYTETL